MLHTPPLESPEAQDTTVVPTRRRRLRKDGSSAPAASQSRRGQRTAFAHRIKGVDSRSSLSTISSTSHASTSHSPLSLAASHSPLSLPSPEPRDILSPAANREQLKNSFIDQFYPRHGSSALDSTTFRLLMTHLSFDSAAVNTALEALFVTQIGSSQHDRALMHQGQVLYTRTLRLLRIELGAGRGAYRDDILATTHLLALCERYASTSAGYTGMITHLHGVARVLAERPAGPLTSDFQILQLLDYLHYAVAYGILQRKPVVAHDSPWVETFRRIPLVAARSPFAVLELPAILQAADRIILDPGRVGTTAVVRVIARLKEMESHVQAQVTRFYGTTAGLPFWFVPLEEDDECRPAFERRFAYPSVTSNALHLTYWTLLMEIQQPIHALLRLLPLPDFAAFSRDAHDGTLAAQIAETADNTAMSAMALCQPENGTFGYFGIVSGVQLLFNYHRRLKGVKGPLAVTAARKVEWCRGMAAKIRSAGVRPPPLDGYPKLGI